MNFKAERSHRQHWKVEAATTPDGKLMGYGTDIGPEGVCYRADLFEKAGLPTDREEVAALLKGDWDTYFSVGKDFVAKTGTPWFDASDGVFQGMINQMENPFESFDGTPIPLGENTEIKAVYDELMVAAQDDDLSANLAQWSEDWVSGFQNDGFATTLCPGWMLGVIEGNAAGVEGWDVADVFPGGSPRPSSSSRPSPPRAPSRARPRRSRARSCCRRPTRSSTTPRPARSCPTGRTP